PEAVPPPEIHFVKPDISGIRARVAEAVGRFPAGAFVRLGSRSPKDAWSWGRDGGQPGLVQQGEDPLRVILDASERAAEDLRMALANDYAPHVFVRQWVDIEPWQEFRCFQRSKKLVGISQYFYRQFLPKVEEHRSTIEWGIRHFHGVFFRP